MNRGSRSWMGATLLLVLGGCQGAPDAKLESSNVQVGPAGSPKGKQCKHVTVSGDVYYNDQRTYGRFPMHLTPDGASGRQYKVVDAEKGTSHGTNHLSLVDATVEVYEVDRVFGGSATECQETSYVASVTTDTSGHFTWTGDVCDPCTLDDGAYETSDAGKVGVSLGLKIVLKYCPDDGGRCLFIKEPVDTSDRPAFDAHDAGATEYAVWHGAASRLDPRRVFADDATIALPDAFFASGGGFTDQWLQAAMVYQGLVESARKLHVQLGIPFRRSEFGAVTAIYPMKWPGHGAGHSHEQLGQDNADSLCIPAPGTEDTDGSVPTEWGGHKTVFHEYGHLINYRAWEGYGKYVDYGFADCNKDTDGDGVDDLADCSGEADSAEFAAAAFKEQWANFIRRLVLNEVRPTVETLDYYGCAFWESGGSNNSLSYDNGDSDASAVCTPPLACDLGDRSPGAVLHTLCDLFDDHVDSNAAPTFRGSDTLGDETLSGLVTDLENTWKNGASWRSDAYIDATGGGDAVKSGFGICELLAQRVARLPSQRSAVDSLLRLNGIACPL